MEAYRKVLKAVEFIDDEVSIHNRSEEEALFPVLEELEEVSKVVVQLFVNHIHKENHILFPLVQKFLTKDALREIARRMV
jgi:iron-sulfur cluster repair protein YtfE (RIC family)